MNMHFTNNKHASFCFVSLPLRMHFVFLSILNHGIIFLKTFYTAIKSGTCSTNTAHNPVEVMTAATAVNKFAHAANDN